MSLRVHLLGRPRLERGDEEVYAFRSRKSWAMLAYLILSGRPASRTELAALLLAEADDPLRALRWSLAEVRRGLGDGGLLEGNPVVLVLPPGTTVDVLTVTSGSWIDAVDFPGLGADLLEGIVVKAAPAFDSWLLSEQRHVAASSEALLHEAAVVCMSRGALPDAIGYAVRAAAMNPIEENHQALLIRLYRMAGDEAAAEQQLATCTETLRRELGVAPGAVVLAARDERRYERPAGTDKASIDAIVEAGAAAVAAGAVDAGVGSLHLAGRMADEQADDRLRVRTRLVLAEALIHSFGGLDEEGLGALHEADRIATAAGDDDAVAEARSEIGYVDFLRARYDRAERWLREAGAFAHDSTALQAKVAAYLGSIASDQGRYPEAIALLDDAVELARAAGQVRRESYALSMSGRLRLLRGELDDAARLLDASLELAQREHWLSFLPWPQALKGSVQLAGGDAGGAARSLQQAFARACQLGDPCWEGMAARELGVLAEATGEPRRAVDLLLDARLRCNRLADPYVWLDAYILDALCDLGRRHRHPDTGSWVDQMSQLASRTGIRELTVRALLHGAALDRPGDAGAAALVAADIDNPVLGSLVASSFHPATNVVTDH